MTGLLSSFEMGGDEEKDEIKLKQRGQNHTLNYYGIRLPRSSGQEELNIITTAHTSHAVALIHLDDSSVPVLAGSVVVR